MTSRNTLVKTMSFYLESFRGYGVLKMYTFWPTLYSRIFAFNALTLMIRHQEEHLTSKQELSSR